MIYICLQFLTVVVMKKLTWILLLLVMLACKSKKKTVPAGDEPVKIEDFIAYFPETRLPYSFTDAELKRKEKDSMKISIEAFNQFVTDSLLSSFIKKDRKPRIYPRARVELGGAGNFLFSKVESGTKQALYVMWFDKNSNYVTGIPLLRTDQMTPTTAHSIVMDPKFTITRTLIRKNADGSSSEGKDVYGLNSEFTAFMLIMTDALEDGVTELINPIDTFTRKHKFSGDYSIGKMNLVSVRDGRKPDRVSFYIHINRNEGDCTGELKGEAIVRSANSAEYREAGDPCVLKFSFSKSSVTLTEIEGCGAHRGLRCSFNGNYTKKKPVTVKKKK